MGFRARLPRPKPWIVVLAQRKTPLNVVLELHVPEDELFQRLASRGRADDKPEVIRHRLETYRLQTEPLLDYYRSRELLKSIDGTGTVEDVFARAQAVLEPFA